jgi:Domain of unknown function (DUF3883)
MLQVVTDSSEIARYQKKIKKRLQEGTTRFQDRKIGCPGGSFSGIYWNKYTEIWCAFSERSTCYWNVFGIGLPKIKETAPMIAQINPAFEGSSTPRVRPAGLFLSDNVSSRIYIAHTGYLGGTFKDFLSDKPFYENVQKGKIIRLEGRKMFVISNIDDKNFQEKIAGFIRAVYFHKYKKPFFSQKDVDVSERLHTPRGGASRLQAVNAPQAAGKQAQEEIETQGFQCDAKYRSEIEAYSMWRVGRILRKIYDTVRDVSREKMQSYDYHCISQDGRCQKVEVKGTRTKGNGVLVSRCEFNLAKKERVNLYVVSNIMIDDDGKAHGGKVTEFKNWGARKLTCNPISYKIILRSGE